MAKLEKKYIVEGNTVRCTNREVKPEESASHAYTFDIILDFTGLCAIKDINETVLGWACATAVIRVQNALRKGDEDVVVAKLRRLEAEKQYTVKASEAGKVVITREPTESELKAHVKKLSPAELLRLMKEAGIDPTATGFGKDTSEEEADVEEE